MEKDGALRLSTNNLSNWIILVPYETLEKLILNILEENKLTLIYY